MTLIEQAIFTSAETDSSAGYRLVAQSPGLSGDDARELTTWCPSHDSLLGRGPDAVSFNFHPLPSGAYCVSRTIPAGAEYSGRGGVRVYTQCLIVRPEELARFSNNPFALLRAALAGGALRVHDEVPEELPPLRLAGRAASVDTALLGRLAANPGAVWVATLVQAALDSAPLAIAGGPAAVHLIAGLINCLPPECRTGFSFSTGLKFSPRRPFRVVGLSDSVDEQRRFRRQHRAPVLDLDGLPPAEFAPNDGWSRFIQRMLVSARTAFIATQFSKRRFELGLKDLPALGLQLLEELDATALRDGRAAEEETGTGGRSIPSDNHAAPGGDRPVERAPWDCPVPGAPPEQDVVTRAHAAHRRFAKTRESVSQARVPSEQLEADSPELLEKLELLDDVVFEAISGDAACQEQLETLWPATRAEFGDQLVAESREQYLRYALSIWEECMEPNGIRDPKRAAAALDVLCVLFDE